MNLYDTDYFKNWNNPPVEDVKYDDQLQSTSFQQPNIDALHYGMSQRFNDPNNWRQNLQHTYGIPGITRNMRNISGEVGEYGQIPGQGNVDMYTPKRNIFSQAVSSLGNFKNTIGQGITGILDNNMLGRLMGGLKNSFQDRPLGTSNVVDEFGNVFDSEDLDKQNARGGYYTDPARSSRRATQRYNNMLEKKALGKKYSPTNLAKMRAVLAKQRELDNRGYSGTPGGNTGSGAFARFDNTTKDYGPHSKGDGQGNQSGGLGSDTPSGHAGGWGPGAKDGGRIGYLDGELVGQETDFIQGPQGGEEFQETVVEGQEQPSREQLEALAMEIFQLPLEELDEQQLVVVYKEAMQGQPMEESVQEEDVQFAANGGLAGLL